MNVQRSVYILVCVSFTFILWSQIHIHTDKRMAKLLQQEAVASDETAYIKKHMHKALPLDRALVDRALMNAAKQNNRELFDILAPFAGRRTHREASQLLAD